MKTEWDYSDLAEAYLKRPDYADAAIDAMISTAGVKSGAQVCDIGAGVAHLTLMHAARGMNVHSVEPNDNMRALGIKRTSDLDNVTWFEGTGEQSGRPAKAYDLVTFGSSFNVVRREEALVETARILKDGGWFACMWNHRDIEETVQRRIEDIIRGHVAEYGYGVRRQDQTEVIAASGLFSDVVRISSDILHQQTKEDCVEAWLSHATLERQAGDKFHNVVNDIEKYLATLPGDSIEISYQTNIWMARKA